MEHKYRLDKSIHHNDHLQRAWNKYGKDSFEFIVIEECEECLLSEREIYYIQEYNTRDQNFGYNQTIGGDGTANLTKESRKKKSEALKSHYRNNPDKAKIRFMHAAESQRTPEARAKKREMTIKQFQDPDFYKRYRDLRSSEEYRKKISESHKGYKIKEETKEKLREISPNKRAVLCVETGIIYRSCKEAARSLPGNKNVQAVAEGKRATAGGYHWKFADEEKEAV